MLRLRPAYRAFLLAGLGLLPLLLVALVAASDMTHDVWFYLVLLLIPLFSAAALFLLTRDRTAETVADRDRALRSARPDRERAPVYSVLVSVTLPSAGVELLRVARALAPPEHLRVTALHMWPEERFRAGAFTQQDADETPAPLRPLLEAAGELAVEPLCLVTADVGADLTAVAREHQADLVLLGWHDPVSPSDYLPAPIQTILRHTTSDVAVYLARHFRPIRRVLVPYTGSFHDEAALNVARRLSRYGNVKVTLVHAKPPRREGDDPPPDPDRIVEGFAPNRVRLKRVDHEELIEAAVREAWMGYDLIVAGASEQAERGAGLFSERHERWAFATAASLLVVQGFRPDAPPEPPASDTHSAP
ncbi:universal stress protein [Rhodocaloribacter sp.]